ncbi:hypothetical protein [Haliangium sp.]|uniref:hypothetical protein n=1 Tax=Haliangium sp. TaxID=2663208 RepID=UPI003D0E384F
MTTSKSSAPVRVTLSAAGPGTDAHTVHWSVENIGDTPVHVLHNKRMPYVLRRDSSLLLLHGVHPPDPDKDYNIIEIPTTVELASKARLEGDVALVPLALRDHYGEAQPGAPLTGKVEVRFAVGWGETPILEGERHRYSIQALLDWQTVTESEPLVVTLPAP